MYYPYKRKYTKRKRPRYQFEIVFVNKAGNTIREVYKTARDIPFALAYANMKGRMNKLSLESCLIKSFTAMVRK